MPYIIRRQHYQTGLFSYFITILGGIAFADRNNLLPVVDMKNYPNAYLYDHEIKHVNAWEYYFEQPGGVSLEDALSCKEYILGQDTVRHNMPPWTSKLFCNHDNELDYWRTVCKKYIRFKPAILDMLARKQAEFDGKRVLGVSIRGTDYVTMKPRAHPVQPTPEKVIAKCQEVMRTGGFDAIYLSTEKCNGLITSITCGSVGVMCLSEGFEYLCVFDLGVYN